MKQFTITLFFLTIHFIGYCQKTIDKETIIKHADSLIRTTKEYLELVKETKYTMNQIKILPDTDNLQNTVDLGDTIKFDMYLFVPGYNSRYINGHWFYYSYKADKIIERGLIQD